MGWKNPPIPWSELERRLSGGRRRTVPPGAEGDSPAWSRRRQPYEAPATVRRTSGRVRYAELHCHSNFSFLDGASHPEELAEEAARLGLEALALTDHDGMYGVVRFAEAARTLGVRTVFGAELSLGLRRPQNGAADPEGSHLLVLARNPDGYARLCRAISESQLGGKDKGKPVYQVSRLAELHGGSWAVLTGCRKGTVPQALLAGGPQAAARELAELCAVFGRDNVFLEIWDHGDPLDSARNDALAELGMRFGVEMVATNNVHYHAPARRPLATALAAVRARRSLDEIDGWLPAASSAHLRSGAEMARLMARWPGAVERAAELGMACAFDLKLVAPKLPDWPVPEGLTEMAYLRELTMAGAARRYGPPSDERVPGAYRQIAYELDMIEQLGFAGYFLVVWDIVEFCRRSDIFCQGRGSAANSAVCYALGITNADAVALGLLFERFLSPERDGPPDIDIDIESDRREEAIQYVYERYGRENAAQVANVITYRPRSAVRDMAKALGFAPGQQDAFSKGIDGWGPLSASADDVPSNVLELARQVEHFPRHLGIHSGGMVICDRPVVEVCPVEWGRMEGRTVLQWDKDDCAATGLVKFDLLGLGMLSALHYAVDLIREHYDVHLDLATIPQDDAVYDMLCEADSVGVFQVESRAQMATLPRLRPRCFYDLVVEVALIRPGPIQGGSVHPYLRRRKGDEPVTYLHPLLEPSLRKTLGVPLFQEQLMQMAIDVAGFSPAESDELRQAMGSKRSRERMERLKGRLYHGMAERGITGETADAIFEKMLAFANFGFPESHSVSFAYLVYASSWIKLYYPDAFLAALLNAQPMGFYSPQSLAADARRHGVQVLGPDVNASSWNATLEPRPGGPGGLGGERAGERSSPSADPPSRQAYATDPTPGGPGGPGGERAGERSSPSADPPSRPGGLGGERAGERSSPSADPPSRRVRLGISSVRSIGEETAKRIAEGRPYVGMEHVARRNGLSAAQVEALATAGAFGCFDVDRRGALWSAGAVAQSRPERLPGIVTGADAPPLPEMTEVERAAADVWATGVSPGSFPTDFVREKLDAMGVTTAAALHRTDHRSRVRVAGVVTHRQRPATAGGVTFVNLEDETGLINVICSRGVWARYRRVARTSAALLVTGRLERVEGVVNVVAERIAALSLAVPAVSRDFR